MAKQQSPWPLRTRPLSFKQAMDIRASGAPAKLLAQEFGITLGHVYKIRRWVPKQTSKRGQQKMSFIKSVCQFNKEILGIQQRPPEPLKKEEYEISKRCLTEELLEFVEANATKDYIGQVDAIIDLMYFSIGVLYKLGLTPKQIEDCCAAVHAANMEKKLGSNAKRATGAADAVKPEGWVPPEHRLHQIIFNKK